MKQLAISVFLTAVLSAAAFAQVSPPAGTMGVDEIRPGMTGYGLTVVTGTAPERFDVEVIGVMHNMAPRRDGILVRVKGLNIEESGIVAGMSGSPVYIDGRLTGAIAFGWTWPKQPIGGITPIADMELALVGSPAAAVASPQSASSWQSISIADAGAGSCLLQGAGGLPALGSGDPASPASAASDIAIPLMMPALTGQARSIAESLFPSGRFLLSEGVSAAPCPGDAGDDSPLQPGSSIFAALVTGDMSAGAVGTVTDVRGREVYAFGHPFLNQDDVEIPMYLSRVLTVFPSSYRSFKLAAPTREIGAFVRDRATGIMGLVGEKAPMVPMTVSIDSGGKSDTYHYEVVRHRALTPEMAALVTASSVTTLGDLLPGSTISYNLTVAYEGGKELDVDWKAAGPECLNCLVSDVAGQLGFTMANPVENLVPESIEVDVRVESSDANAAIESVQVRESEVYPGDTIHLAVTVKPVLADRVTIPLELKVPATAAPGPKAVIVCDGRTSDVLDLQEARHVLAPRGADDLLALLKPELGPSHLVARMATVDYGLAVAGRALPKLPSSTLSMLAAPQETALSPVLRSAKAPVDTAYVLSGRTVVSVNVKSPAEEK